MRLLFIRHGDPNYDLDILTEKGKREAALLAKRVSKWQVTDFFVSPLGRAQETAQIAMKESGREAETCDWLQEFHYQVRDPETGKNKIAWDWLPSFYTDPANKALLDADKWMHTPVMQSGNIAQRFEEVCAGFDGILARYGFVRDGGIYRTDGTHCQKGVFNDSIAPVKQSYDDRTLVFFCHLGVMFAIIAHLIKISPVQLWQGFYVAPTSVSALASEERVPGSAFFRVQTFGDTNHLHDGNEAPSAAGYFTDVFFD